MLKTLLATFVIMSQFAIAEEQTEKIEKPSTEKPPTQCHDLHKVTDIDDLLLQMYNNLDSHCLFEIPKEELAKAWGFPVFSDFKDYRKMREHEDSGDGFFINRFFSERDKCRSNLVVQKTKKYQKKYPAFGGSILKGKFPENIPEPSLTIPMNLTNPWIVSECRNEQTKEQITDYDIYSINIWYKKNVKNTPSLHINKYCKAESIRITVYYCNFDFLDNLGRWKND